MKLFSKVFGAKAPTYEVEDIYRDMRGQVLGLAQGEPAACGAGDPGAIRAVMVETGCDDYCYSLVAAADGALSLYLSNGGGTIGTGEWRKAARMSQEFVRGAARFAAHLAPATEHPLPGAGRTGIYLVKAGEVLMAQHREAELGNDKLPLSPLFHHAHHLISVIRRVSELRQHESPLVFGAEMGEVEQVKAELANGADPNTRSTAGIPAVGVAVCGREAEIVSLLLAAGVDPGTRIEGEGRGVRDAPLLCAAAAMGALDCVEVLLAAGARIADQEATGLTALHAAAFMGHEDVVERLLGAGADVESREESGYTPLMMAANAGKATCVQRLLEAGAQHGARDRDGSTAIMFAAQHGHLEIVTRLLAAGADPAVAGSHGLSAIGFAEQNGHAAVVQALRA